MAYIDQALLEFKKIFENAILTGGTKGKQSMIRSSQLINLIHDAVKYELQQCGVHPMQIYPHFGMTTPEVKLAGFLKQKDQDICVLPRGVTQRPVRIDWGPMAFQGKTDAYGPAYASQILVINVRSQMSSLAKNADTLFERTYAEAQNLHMRYPEMVLGDVYLIPIREYDDGAVSQNRVAFKPAFTDVEKYISFFHAIHNRKQDEEPYKYERCALLAVDFSQKEPYLFRSSEELRNAGIISRNFSIEYGELGFDTFAKDILGVYAERFPVQNLCI